MKTGGALLYKAENVGQIEASDATHGR